MDSSPPAKRRRQSDTGDDRKTVSASTTLGKLSPVVVFAHGAGAPSTSDWMIRFLSSFSPFGSVHISQIMKSIA